MRGLSVRTPVTPSFLHWYYDENNDPTAEVDFIFGLVGNAPIAGNWQLSELSVALGGTILSSPTSATLGSGNPGELPSSRQYQIANVGTATLAISSPSVPNGFTVTGLPSSIASGVTQTFTVQRDPSVPGFQSGAFTFGTNDGSLGESVFQINLSEAQPEIEVSEPRNGTTNIGSGLEGTVVEKDITVQNTGADLLTLGTPNVSGPFQVNGFPSSLPSGASATFQIRADSSTSGTKTGSISLPNNDANENPYAFNLTATINPVTLPPEIQVRRGSGTSGPIILDNTGSDSFTTSQGAAGNRSVTVQNIGSSTLTIQTPQFTGPFSLVSAGFPRNIAPGSNTVFTYTVSTETAGTKTGTISFANNDPNEAPFNFALQATVTALPTPEIEIRNIQSQLIPDNIGSDSFTASLNSSGRRSLRIRNTGNGNLVVQAPTFSGPFSGVTTGYPKTIGPNSTMTVEYQVNTSTTGVKNGTISFINNDNDENPYNFSLQATVESPLVARHYFSLDSPRTLSGGVSLADSDIGEIKIFSDGSFEFSKLFDGGANGLSSGIEAIDAFTILGGSYLISTENGGSVPISGGGSMSFTASDLMLFNPNTNVWTKHFDGSNHGLAFKDIDGVASLFGNRLLISLSDSGTTTLSGAGTSTVLARDEDVVTFHADTGVWAPYLDGSQENLISGNADIDAVSITDGLEISTLGFASILNGPSIFENTVVQRVGNGWTESFDGGDYGISGVNIDAFHTVLATAPNRIETDYGDAPLPYPTANHQPGGPILGSLVDHESDSQPHPDALGDDTDVFFARSGDDEDGVVIPANPLQGSTISVDVTVGEETGVLNAWFDFNADGDFDDLSEHVILDTSLAPGTHTLNVNIPPSASAGRTFARFRISENGINAPVGLEADGEVEDYAVDIQPLPSFLLIRGTNDSDTIDVEETATDIVVTVNGNVSTYPISTVSSVDVNGRSGNDVMRRLGGSSIPVILRGGNGNDIIEGNSGPDSLYGNAGRDLIKGNGGNDFIDGGLGFDTLRGGSGDDTILGGKGNDRIFGQAGNDQLSGNAGDDIVVGGSGSDNITGDADRDLLIGGTGMDVLAGNNGADLLFGAATSIDNDSALLDQIMAEWKSANGYNVRVNNLRNGSGSASPANGTLYIPSIVIPDTALDELNGDNGRDYFWGLSTEIRDLDGNELFDS